MCYQVIIYIVDDVINFKIYKIYLRSTSKTMAEKGKKRRRQIEKSEYLENKKSILDEIKNIFHSF